jgi:predicted TPR repeat methyltransferase
MTQSSTNDTIQARLLAIEGDVRSGRLRAAAAALDALATTSPADVRIHLCGAALARAAANASLEIEALKHAVSVAPDAQHVQIELAKALSRHGRHRQAVVAVNRAIELDPANIPALAVAVAVAEAAGAPALAQRHLQSAAALRPGDMSIRRSLGRNLTRQGRYAEAEPHLRAVLDAFPEDLPALKWLSSCLLELGRREEAGELLQRIQSLAPGEPTLPYYLALARGETPPTAPPGMTREIFDNYADRFDAHLLGALQYRAPQRVAGLIRQRTPSPNIDVLDLGCGTGLVGAELGRLGGSLVGVDLSARMLERAAMLGVYSDLKHADLLDALRQTRPGSFDYVTAADVFIYVGELSEVIPAAFACLRAGGAMVFSCESADESEGDLVLRASKRYAHSRASIESLCGKAGFSHCAFEAIDLRLENKAPIAGFITLAAKT